MSHQIFLNYKSIHCSYSLPSAFEAISTIMFQRGCFHCFLPNSSWPSSFPFLGTCNPTHHILVFSGSLSTHQSVRASPSALVGQSLSLLRGGTILSTSEPNVQITASVFTKDGYIPDKVLRGKKDLSKIDEENSDLHM